MYALSFASLCLYVALLGPLQTEDPPAAGPAEDRPASAFTTTPGGPTLGWNYYCSSAPNSAGPGARIEARGSASVAAADLELIATGLPGSGITIKFVRLVHSSAPSTGTWGCGFACVATPTVGMNGFFVPSSSRVSWVYDNSSPERTLAPFIGSTRYFQWRYSDPTNEPVCGAWSNTSDAVGMTILP